MNAKLADCIFVPESPRDALCSASKPIWQRQHNVRSAESGKGGSVERRQTLRLPVTVVGENWVNDLVEGLLYAALALLRLFQWLGKII
jgi:hypothetical protein